jgi:hypothetical protein
VVDSQAAEVVDTQPFHPDHKPAKDFKSMDNCWNKLDKSYWKKNPNPEAAAAVVVDSEVLLPVHMVPHQLHLVHMVPHPAHTVFHQAHMVLQEVDALSELIWDKLYKPSKLLNTINNLANNQAVVDIAVDQLPAIQLHPAHMVPHNVHHPVATEHLSKCQ